MDYISIVRKLFDSGDGPRRVGRAGEKTGFGSWRLPARSGWYYYSAAYPENGAVGPFPTENAARTAAGLTLP